MKRLLLYFIALTCAVCILSGCRKEERKEDRKPVIEGVYWCPERMKDSELPEPIMFHDGILDSYKYVTSEEEADKITQGTGVTVKKGYMLRYPTKTAYPAPLRSQTSHLGMKKLTPMYSVNLPQTVC